MLAELDLGLCGTSAPFMVLDCQGRILVWNHACSVLTGYAFEEVRGNYPWQYVAAPAEQPRVRESLLRILAGESALPLNGYLVDKAGELRWMEWLHNVVRRS